MDDYGVETPNEEALTQAPKEVSPYHIFTNLAMHIGGEERRRSESSSQGGV